MPSVESTFSLWPSLLTLEFLQYAYLKVGLEQSRSDFVSNGENYVSHFRNALLHWASTRRKFSIALSAVCKRISKTEQQFG